MRRIIPLLALSLLVAPAAMAASPAQLDAMRQVDQDQREDRVTDRARDLMARTPSTSALVDDMNGQRPSRLRDGVSPNSTARATPDNTLPLLSDNAQR